MSHGRVIKVNCKKKEMNKLYLIDLIKLYEFHVIFSIDILPVQF